MADEPNSQPEQPAYTAPATQADFDRIIADRVSRERAKFADYADLKAKAAEHDKAQEAAKSDLQKAMERAEAAEKRAQEYEQRDQRAKWAAAIVKDSKVPASALRGSTEDELKAHFEELKALIPAEEAPKPKPGAVGPYVPTEGSNPTGTLGGPRQAFANFLSGQLSR